MADDLLDYWVRMIETIFPENAWISSRFYNNDYSIQIDWNLENGSKPLNRRSRKIEIIIKEGFIEDYLDGNENNRELSDGMLKNLIRERFYHFNSDDHCANFHLPAQRWLIPRHAFSRKPH